MDLPAWTAWPTASLMGSAGCSEGRVSGLMMARDRHRDGQGENSAPYIACGGYKQIRWLMIVNCWWENNISHQVRFYGDVLLVTVWYTSRWNKWMKTSRWFDLRQVDWRQMSITLQSETRTFSSHIDVPTHLQIVISLLLLTSVSSLPVRYVTVTLRFAFIRSCQAISLHNIFLLTDYAFTSLDWENV